MQGALEEFMQARTRADERFQAFVSEELGLLKGEVARCVWTLCVWFGGIGGWDTRGAKRVETEINQQ